MRRFEARSIPVERSARYAVLGEASPEVETLWIVLHGYRQLATRFLSRFLPIESPRRLIVAAEALNRFYVGDPSGRHGPDAKVGATWMTREARELEISDYVGYLDRLAHHQLQALEGLGAGLPRIVVLGFSQGAHTASRWAALGETRVDEVVLWAEHLAHDLDLEAVSERWIEADTRVHLVRGESDRFHPEARHAAEADRLAEFGVDIRTHLHPGAHDIHRESLPEIAEAVETR